jgi:DNA-binding CsgD family transcriptional regulator
MVDTLVKLWQSNKSKESTNGLQDLVKGYKDFEQICNMWNTYIYMHDYRSNKYIYISPSFCNYLGIEHSTTLADGFDSISSLIHPDDLLILENTLFKRITYFLSTLPESEQENQNYRFSYNFRIRKKDGNYVSMSIVSKILGFNSKGKIQVDFGMITPAIHVIQTDNILLAISKANGEDDYTTVFQEEYKKENSNLHLTKRELEIIQLLKAGMDSKSIADHLCISLNTTKNHRRNIFEKTNTNKVTELLSLVNKLGL